MTPAYRRASEIILVAEGVLSTNPKDDGVFGLITLRAARAATLDTLDTFMALRAKRYAEDDEEDFQEFGKGWFRRLFKIARLAQT